MNIDNMVAESFLSWKLSSTYLSILRIGGLLSFALLAVEINLAGDFGLDLGVGEYDAVGHFFYHPTVLFGDGLSFIIGDEDAYTLFFAH